MLPIDDPGSRLFGLNILSSFFLIAIYLLLTDRSLRRVDQWRKFQRLVFRRRYWWNHSTKKDYQLYLLNSVIKLFLLVPFVQLSFWVSTQILRIFLILFGYIPSIQPDVINLLLFSVCAFCFDDFLRFLHHLLMHKVPFLWELHKTHHSAKILTPFTLYRIHPIESIIATIRNTISFGISLGAFLFFFDGDKNVFTLFGVNSFGLVFNLLGSNLRHSHIALSFGPLEHVFISPAQHQLHHLKNSRNCNYGVTIALWDWLIGSWMKAKPGMKIRFGL